MDELILDILTSIFVVSGLLIIVWILFMKIWS